MISSFGIHGIWDCLRLSQHQEVKGSRRLGKKPQFAA
jgi:hypothetical protein